MPEFEQAHAAVNKLSFSASAYRAIRDRIRAQDPQIDEQTLADTVEGLTDVHEVLAAIVRAALADEALVNGLKCRLGDMQDRLERLQDRAAKRRQVVKDTMVELDLTKLTAPDFTASIRPGMPALVVLDEEAVQCLRPIGSRASLACAGRSWLMILKVAPKSLARRCPTPNQF